MDQNDATRGTSRDLRASRIKRFLAEALVGGEKTVLALQERARAAGLLGQRQSITDSKSFRSAKAALDVRSHRIGFGRGATWFWVLSAPPTPEGATPVALPVDIYEVAPSDRAHETSPCYAESLCGHPHGAPIEWIRGVDILRQRPRPLSVPAHRWRLFVDDSKRFLSSPLAERAAQLGWNIAELFGSRHETAHEHLGSSGLLWNLAGGQIVQIHVDGADLLAADGRLRRFHRPNSDDGLSPLGMKVGIDVCPVGEQIARAVSHRSPTLDGGHLLSDAHLI
jgi:hypothetical protein